MSRTLKFAEMLAAELRNGDRRSADALGHFVCGELDTGPAVVRLEILIPVLFRDLKRLPPVVQCSEPWMRTGADWHNGPPMCWVLPHEWRDAMQWRGKAVDAILSEGRLWLLKNVRSLVNRHYYAHLAGIKTWPEEWDCWSHGLEGVDEYRRSRRCTSGSSERS